MHNWFASRLGRRPSYTNTLVAIAVFVVLGMVFFHVFDGASIFFGNNRPRLQSFMTIVMSAAGLALLVVLVGPPRLPQPGKFSVPVLLLITIALCAVISFYAFANYAWSSDEYAYLFEADTFKALRLWNTPPPLGSAETTLYVWVKDGKWVAQYPPGWPLILALFGGSFPTGRLANGVCTAIAAWAVFELVKERANREAAWIAVLFFVLTPFTLINGGSLFSHPSAAALSALTVLISSKTKHSQRSWPLIALGACIGLLGITRNVAAVAVLIAIAIDQFQTDQRIKRIILIGLGGLPFLAGLLAYQYMITGDATMPVYWYAGRTIDHLYFDWRSIREGLHHTQLSQAEFTLFTSPIILLLWGSAMWKVFKTKTFNASDIIMPLGMLIFVFYPLHPGHRAGPRYYFDFWPLAVVTIGAAMPRFAGSWRNLYAGAVAVSIVYAGTMSVFVAVELRGIILSRFDIFEVAKANAISNALVCVAAPTESEDVFARQGYFGVARNGVDIGDPAKALQRDIIFLDCREMKLAQLKAAYPARTIWEYKEGLGRRSPGTLQLMKG